MNKTTQLLIRACKSKNPQKRLISIHKRFYLTHVSEEERLIILCDLLSTIVDEYCPISTSSFISNLSPSSNWLFEGLTYYERVLRILIARIQYSYAKEFAGLTSPTFSRNADKYTFRH